MEDFATPQDIIDLWRELTPEEMSRAIALIPVVSNSLRVEADKVGKDIDAMVLASEVYHDVVMAVTVDIVARTLMTSTSGEPSIQSTQSALGYSQTATFLVPGGGLFIKNSELSRLGLRRQRYGALDIFGVNTLSGSGDNYA